MVVGGWQSLKKEIGWSLYTSQIRDDYLVESIYADALSLYLQWTPKRQSCLTSSFWSDSVVWSCFMNSSRFAPLNSSRSPAIP